MSMYKETLSHTHLFAPHQYFLYIYKGYSLIIHYNEHKTCKYEFENYVFRLPYTLHVEFYKNLSCGLCWPSENLFFSLDGLFSE